MVRARFGCLLAIAGFVVCVPAAVAQVSVILPNSFEVGAFVGASYGIDQFRVMGGGNVTYAINKYILPYGEFSYFPGIGRSQTGAFGGTGNPFNFKYSIPLSDFHGGVHIRIPIKEKPIVPYGVFGLGGLSHSRHTVTANYSVSGVAQTPVQLDVPGGTDFAINFGGGVRYYVTQRFGFRVEAKTYKPFGAGAFSSLFGKVEGGIFLQLK